MFEIRFFFSVKMMKFGVGEWFSNAATLLTYHSNEKTIVIFRRPLRKMRKFAQITTIIESWLLHANSEPVCNETG
jgi:hypothetical protein